MGSFDFVSGTQVANGNFVGIYPGTGNDVFNTSIVHYLPLKQDGILENEIPMYGSFVADGTGKYKIQFNHACGIVRIILSGNAEKVEKCKAIRFSNFGTYYLPVKIKIDNKGSLSYVKSTTVATMDVAFSDEIKVVDGKKTIDVLFAPMTNVDCGVYFKENISDGGDPIVKNYTKLTVEAGKIKVINVNFK